MAATRPAPVGGVHPEIAYDLVLDHAALIMALDQRPRGLDDLAAQTGETVGQVAERIGELLAAGLVEQRAHGFAACASTYELLRQEAGIDFLRDQVLPSLTPVLASSEPDGLLHEAEGRLGELGVAGLESALIAGFGETLGNIPAPTPRQGRSLATLLLCGTATRPPQATGSVSERAIWRLTTASRERDEERALGRAGRSFIYQYRIILDDAGWRQTQRAIEGLMQGMATTRGQSYFGITLACLRRASRMAQEGSR